MRDDEIRARLVENNPWWRALGGDPVGWTAADQVLRSRSRYDLGYRADVLDDVADGPVDDKLVVLQGPRRVGKSVLLKDTASRLCARTDVDVRQVIYLATDGMRAGDLNRVAVLGRELTRSVGDRARVWLFDEVTSIPSWTETIKYLRDQTTMGDDTVICTGSSWDPDSNVDRDLLAGRAGRNSTKRLRLLLPMRFRDVATATGRELPLPGPVPVWDLCGDAAREAAIAAELYTSEHDLAWQAYLTSGGFPRAVGEHERDGDISESFVADLAAWLQRDVDPDAAPDSVPLLTDGLFRRSTSPLNRTATANDLGYTNRQTFDVRLHRLANSFAALWCPQVDDEGKAVAGAQAKLYLTDPLLCTLGHRLRSGLGAPDYTRLSEGALAVALAQAIEDLQPGRWAAQDTVGYLRTGSGNEIDFAPVAVPTPAGSGRTTAIESKWVSSGWRSEAKVLENKLQSGILATRSIVDTSHPVWALPASLVALLLG